MAFFNDKIDLAIFITKNRKIIKTTLIAAAIIIVVLIVGTVVYDFANPEPDCFIDADCGEINICNNGRCVLDVTKIPPEDIKLTVTDEQVVPDGKDNFDAIFFVKDADPVWGAKSFKYHASFVDAAGNTIAERDGEDYILPRETKAVTLLDIESNKSIDDVEITFSDEDWARLESSANIPEVEVRTSEYRRVQVGSGEGEAVTDLFNDTGYAFNEVTIVFVAKKQNNIVAVNATTINEFRNNTRREVIVFWPEYQKGITEVDVYPYVNVYDSSVFFKQFKEQPISEKSVEIEEE